jgi:hypothetical protein
VPRLIRAGAIARRRERPSIGLRTCPTEALEEALMPSDNDLAQIEADIKVIKNILAKGKDGWDKAGIVSQFLSGFLIAGLGVAVTIMMHNQDDEQHALQLKLNKDQFNSQQTLQEQQILAQQTHDKSEVDLESKRDYFTFLEILSKAATPAERSLLLNQLEDTLTPVEAAHTAVNYLRPAFALSQNATDAANDQISYESAVRVSEEFIAFDKDELQHIAKNHPKPESEIAAAILGRPTQMWVRASSIDDFADLELDGHSLIPRMVFGQDSGWLSLTDSQIHKWAGEKTEYLLTFLVTNGAAGGFGGRLQISNGLQQYDTGPYAVNACPCNGPAFKVTIHLKHLPNHRILIDREEPYYY